VHITCQDRGLQLATGDAQVVGQPVQEREMIGERLVREDRFLVAEGGPGRCSSANHRSPGSASTASGSGPWSPASSPPAGRWPSSAFPVVQYVRS